MDMSKIDELRSLVSSVNQLVEEDEKEILKATIIRILIELLHEAEGI